MRCAYGASVLCLCAFSHFSFDSRISHAFICLLPAAVVVVDTPAPCDMCVTWCFSIDRCSLSASELLNAHTHTHSLTEYCFAIVSISILKMQQVSLLYHLLSGYLLLRTQTLLRFITFFAASHSRFNHIYRNCWTPHVHQIEKINIIICGLKFSEEVPWMYETS